ncbi:hypothetical protein H9655_16440 [Cytobacillus sp. Sa5YUA1]|uniref:Peptidase A2 domain-containing protein n=1 Tax=Cytobacillus stercorigallinarum TaxID=2762240 RepID=A0ABR8QT73_9BACI|nr:hypothetical protein [Cytobacillus stercorigallinarum]MBD7938624.1 hypothetical protein [Cytobacillus stercorigallinarum]
MAKILIITTRPLEASISSSIRKIATVKSLVDAGADVTVLTTQIPKDSSQYNNLADVGEIKTIRVNTGVLYNAGVTKKRNVNSRTSIQKKIKLNLRNLYLKFKIFDPLKASIRYVDAITNELESKYDIILSISDPKSSHLLAIHLIENQIISCIDYLQIWGDPMYLDITNKSIIPKFIIKSEEKKILAKADKVYYVSPLTMEEEKKLFPELKHKMDVLFPTYKQETIYEPISKIRKVGYFGDYKSSIRNIYPLYNAIKGSKYQLIVCGNSNLNLYSTDNIKINGRVSFEEVKNLEKDVDLLILLSNNFGTQIPGKIYQYLGTNKPILFILDGDKKSLVKMFEKYNRVIFCENNEKDILKKIEEFNNGEIKLDINPVKEFNNESIARKILN